MILKALLRLCILVLLGFPFRAFALPAVPLETHTLADGLRLAQQENKPLFVLIGMDWCRHTRKVRDEYLADAEVRQVLDNYAITQIVHGPAPQLVGLYGTHGYPTLLVYSHTGKELWRVVGEPAREAFIAGLKSARKADSGGMAAARSVRGQTSASASSSPSLAGMPDGREFPAKSTTLTFDGDNQLLLAGEDGAMILDPQNLGLKQLTSKDGEIIRFIQDEGGTHIAKAISNRSQISAVSYIDGPDGTKVSTLEFRRATDDELKSVGLSATLARTETASEKLSFDYDAAGNLSQVQREIGGKTDKLMKLEYDAERRVEILEDAIAGRRINFRYDSNGRITIFNLARTDGARDSPAHDTGGDMGAGSDTDSEVSADVSTTLEQFLVILNEASAEALRYSHFFY